MAISPFDSATAGDLLGDAEVRQLFDDRRQVRNMLLVEAALARVQGYLGVIPGGAAERIARAADRMQADLEAIARGTIADGVPVPELVRQLRSVLDAEAAQWVHHGATSQDVVDTALVLALRELADLVDQRLCDVARELARLAAYHRGTLCLARTRTQPAVPTSFGLRVVAWLRPLVAERRRLTALRSHVLRVQFGGAAGNLSALGADGPEVADALADELALARAVPAWHSERDGLLAFADALARLTGALGKLGQDVAHGCQREVAELGLAGGGGSSTMPQKANPVAAETLVALARHAAGTLAGLHQAQLHGLERDGAAWTQEWLALPQLAACCGGALAGASRLLESLHVNADRMAEHVTGGTGAPLAEAAAFALAPHLGREAAQARVAAAVEQASVERRHLLDVLAKQTDAPVDWATMRVPARLLGNAPELVDRALGELPPGIRG